MKCPKCNFENRQDAKFCLECGERVALECRSCAILLPLSAKFCDKCGKSYDELTQSDEDEESIEYIARNSVSLKEASNKFEKIFLLRKLEEFNWNVSKTANAIGLERSNLHRKMKKYKISGPHK